MKRQIVKDELMVSNKTENLSCVRDFMQRNLARTYLAEKDSRQIVLAVDEAVSNIIRHAYEDFAKGTRTIDIQVYADTAKIEIILKDSGREFDPNSVPSPCIEEHVKLGKRYGLGLFLMRRIMDEVKYVFKSGIENMLTLVKYIEQTEKEKPRKVGEEIE